VLAATSRPDEKGLQYADDSLLEDDSFAVEARRMYCFCRVASLSGRTCIVPLDWDSVEANGPVDVYEYLLSEAGVKLGMGTLLPGEGTLLFGREEVSRNHAVKDWPGSPAQSAIVNYQLVNSNRAWTDIA